MLCRPRVLRRGLQWTASDYDTIRLYPTSYSLCSLLLHSRSLLSPVYCCYPPLPPRILLISTPPRSLSICTIGVSCHPLSSSESQMSEEEGGNLLFGEEGEAVEVVRVVSVEKDLEAVVNLAVEEEAVMVYDHSVTSPNSPSLPSTSNLLVVVLTKLGYLIDNPWSNALDRARAAGLVLASVLRSRQLGVQPIGFSLGARSLRARVGEEWGIRHSPPRRHPQWRVVLLLCSVEFEGGGVWGIRSLFFHGIEEPDLEGHRVVLPSTSTSSTSPDTETNASTLSWFARKKANAAKAAAQEEAEQRQKEERTKAGVHVQRPPSYASWVGRGKGEEKAEEELPPREGRDTPPLPTRMASPTPILGSDSHSSTPTSNSNSNSNSTSSFSSTTSTSSTTNSGHITSFHPLLLHSLHYPFYYHSHSHYSHPH
ncbi:hypothetical protein F5051DRAFT_507390 [Lentinula edodes]|nr:hypothetical protein F5051DRAFT_507390 [Lentinula edodes]